MSQDQRVELAPHERRWVEVSIDQASGSEVTQFKQPYQLAVTGLIDGQLIGGMTFYLAPPKAFPQPDFGPDHHRREVSRPGDLVSLNIPWSECAVEGEIDIKIHFKRE